MCVVTPVTSVSSPSPQKPLPRMPNVSETHDNVAHDEELKRLRAEVVELRRESSLLKETIQKNHILDIENNKLRTELEALRKMSNTNDSDAIDDIVRSTGRARADSGAVVPVVRSPKLGGLKPPVMKSVVPKLSLPTTSSPAKKASTTTASRTIQTARNVPVAKIPTSRAKSSMTSGTPRGNSSSKQTANPPPPPKSSRARTSLGNERADITRPTASSNKKVGTKKSTAESDVRSSRPDSSRLTSKPPGSTSLIKPPGSKIGTLKPPQHLRPSATSKMPIRPSLSSGLKAPSTWNAKSGPMVAPSTHERRIT